jgi:hypothetical protein
MKLRKRFIKIKEIYEKLLIYVFLVTTIKTNTLMLDQNQYDRVLLYQTIS